MKSLKKMHETDRYSSSEIEKLCEKEFVTCQDKKNSFLDNLRSTKDNLFGIKDKISR